jgi:transposase InsO family protein
MSRPGTPYDNAPMEAFFSILKNEELKLYKNRTTEQMRRLIQRFISYYNLQRPQWGLKKLTPAEFSGQLA